MDYKVRISQAVIAVAIVATVAGGVFLVARARTSGGIEIIPPTATVAPGVAMKVYVTGAVREPGVYDMAEGSRLADVVQAAGGTTGDADLAAVNLAARLSDEQHWHIPSLGEAPLESAAQDLRSPSAATSGKIDINSAGVVILTNLPGIGIMKATAIVTYRKAVGPFPDVDALLAVDGIGPATLEAIRGMIEAR